MQFRKDINGLRAIAVISVVLFHFDAALMPGGFAGVDVFFVISGFLMTGIIFRGVENENFSILKFYLSRANRIIPPLAALCIVLMILGWFYLPPLELKTLGKHVGSSIGFISNEVYMRESSYFDTASHEKWLLHTWSLSVEWQFYIIYPIVLVVMRRFVSLKTVKLFILIATLIGCLFSAIATNLWPNFSYYSFSTRAWEMLFGGVAYLYPLTLQKSKSKLLELFGIGLILSSYILVSSNNAWPGYLAAIPVLGAFLVIQAQNNNSFITGNIIFQKLGSWSYSIYLWHWPFVVTIYYLSLHRIFIVIGIALSILLGFLSYQFIEKIRFKSNFNTFFGYLKYKPLYIALITGTLGSICFLYKRDLSGINEEHLLGHYYFNSEQQLTFNKDNEVKVFNANQDTDLLMLGDSNSAHYSYGITNTGNLRIANRWVASCFSFIDMNTKSNAQWMNKNWEERCHSLYKFVDTNKHIPVIIAHSWESREMECLQNCSSHEENYKLILKNELEKLIRYIGNRKIFIIGQVPAPENSMIKCMRSFDNSNCERISSNFGDRIDTNSLLSDISNLYDNVFFINPFNAICNEQNECNTIIDDKNLFYDTVHLSAFGSKEVWPYIENEIAKELDN